MASYGGSRRTLEARSGGKIVRARRTAGSRKPYDRPRVVDSEEPQNPSWISRLILSPTRAIAVGAGKLVSSVFSQDDDDDEDSDSDDDSSSSSSEGDSGSEGNIENNDDENDFTSQRDVMSKERKRKSETINYFGKDPESASGGSDTKRTIEKLIMQVTFSWDECSNLIKMIKSRVVDLHTKDLEIDRLTQTPKQAFGGADDQDLRCTAVMEARKWFSEKKLKSASKSDLNNGVEDEVGSPVDMAKLYMRTRPLWASPTFKHGEFSSLSPAGTHLFKEETAYSFGDNTLSSSKPKRDTPTTGSWNIQQEIQRVRAKATEELLSTLPSLKMDWSSFAPEKRSSPKPLLAENIYAKAIEKVYNATKPIDSSSQTLSGDGIQCLESTQAEVQDETSLRNEVTVITEKNQDLEGTYILDGGGQKGDLEDMGCEEPRFHSSQFSETSNVAFDVVLDHKDPIAVDMELNNIVEESIEDPRSLNSKEKESAYTTNGLPLSGHSLPEETLPDKDSRLDGEEYIEVSSSSDKIVTDAFEGETSELLSEFSVDISNLNESQNEDDYIANGSPSRNNQSPRYPTRQGSKRSVAPIATDNDKKPGKRLGKTNKKKPGIPT